MAERRPKTNKPWTASEIRRCVELRWRDGLGYVAIAEILGRTVSSVCGRFYKEKLGRPPPRREQRWLEVLTFARSTTEAAGLMGVKRATVSTVACRLRKHGFDIPHLPRKWTPPPEVRPDDEEDE